ncbi:hypothetical protein [Bradyrhizobium sp. STM 3843]|uniref:hypothetical protein n=1 Tax=Bradyrhizobium sp. STM 3843 TaxID=551947 RepID=UPI00055A8F0B|nr:hypothetical protein [Bradyrhizobium sp. STM 3843]
MSAKEKAVAQLVHMVWKGVSGDSGIYHATFFFDSQGRPAWGPQNKINGVGTSASPAITSFFGDVVPIPRTELFMAWKGIPHDQGIYWSRDLGSQADVPHIGTSHGLALAPQPNQYIYMAWKGIEGDSGIYWSFNNLFHGLEGWAPQQNVRGVGTSDKPALAYRFPKLYMAWKGIRGDSGIYCSINQGDSSWRPQHRVPNVGTSTGPALAFFKGALHMVWKGIEGDSGLYHASSTDDGLNWTPQQRISGVGTSHSPALTVFNDRLFMAWKGIPGDSGLYFSSSLDGLHWDPQGNVPDVGSSDGPSLALS